MFVKSNLWPLTSYSILEPSEREVQQIVRPVFEKPRTFVIGGPFQSLPYGLPGCCEPECHRIAEFQQHTIHRESQRVVRVEYFCSQHKILQETRDKADE